MKGLGIFGKEMAMLGVFAICMYCGFIYHSGWAFLGAVIVFLSIGNKEHEEESD